MTTPNGAEIMQKIQKGFLVAALLAGVAVVGFSIFRDTPERGAREFGEAVVSFDIERAKGRVCNELSAELSRGEQQLRQAKAIMELSGGSINVDLSQVNFTSQIDGNTAEVTATGRVKVAIRDRAGQTEVQEQEIPPNFRFRMLQENGTWKFCDRIPS